LEPIFTIPWPEFVVAEKLQNNLLRRDGYSIFVPLSRQEKGIDLAILKKIDILESSVVTIQVKASRTYVSQAPKRKGTFRFQYYTWFNRFDVPERADFIVLFGNYPINLGNHGIGSKIRYQDYSILFTNEEMQQFFNDCKTKSGKPDSMFGFGFNDLSKIVQTRCNIEKTIKNYANFLLEKRLDDIINKLAGKLLNQKEPEILQLVEN
jgi:hypothetical protein